jgi:hypothetical protein
MSAPAPPARPRGERPASLTVRAGRAPAEALAA